MWLVCSTVAIAYIRTFVCIPHTCEAQKHAGKKLPNRQANTVNTDNFCAYAQPYSNNCRNLEERSSHSSPLFGPAWAEINCHFGKAPMMVMVAFGRAFNCVMEGLQILLGHLFDIFKIYLKFGLITLVFYFVAEWYILHYTDFDTFMEPQPLLKPVSNSTASKVYRFVLDFFLG